MRYFIKYTNCRDVEEYQSAKSRDRALEIKQELGETGAYPVNRN